MADVKKAGKVSIRLAALDGAIAKASVTFRGVRMSSKQRRMIATGKNGRGVQNLKHRSGDFALIASGGASPTTKRGLRGSLLAVDGGKARRTPSATQRAVASRLRGVYKAKPKTLYVYRPVENAEDIIAWAKSQGFKTTLAPEDLHVTLAYSKTPLNWAKLYDDYHFEPSEQAVASCGLGPVLRSADGGDAKRRIKGGVREVKALGAEGAIVLAFESDTLTRRWMDFKSAGAAWSFPSFAPHVTITYDGDGVDLDKVAPYVGDIVLGEECWEEVKEGGQAEAMARETAGVKKAVAEIGERLGAVEKRLEKVG